ncbi:response regulator transcription factor [Spirosoma pulveris]
MQHQPDLKHEENELPNRAILDLTSREWDVLMHITQDLTNSEIADQLAVTSKSVENYRARIGSKLGLKRMVR